MHRAILIQMESLGWAVSVHKIPASLLGTVGEFVELHAVNLKTEEVKIAHCHDGTGPDEVYRAACAMAEMVGIDLKG